MITAKSLTFYIEHLGLQQHPEGGWFSEVYRSALEVDVPWSNEKRSAATSIYFLLKSADFSSFHRIKSDELWHFYDGTAIEIYWFDGNGKLNSYLLGRDTEAGELLQCVIPAGCWFAAHVKATDSFALVGCTVSPGFDFADFEMARRESLISEYPEYRDVIEDFTRA